MKYRCRTPDTFGFIASMTYDNPHVALPAGGSALGGMERAQLLEDMRVRIGDVHWDQAVDHVALAGFLSKEAEEREFGGLKEDRLYL